MTFCLQGRTMLTRAAHAASFCGSPITVGVTAPNMHQTKYQVDMNINSYIGQLRQQVASKPAFSLPPARLRMFLGGTHRTPSFLHLLCTESLPGSDSTEPEVPFACWSVCQPVRLQLHSAMLIMSTVSVSPIHAVLVPVVQQV